MSAIGGQLEDPRLVGIRIVGVRNEHTNRRHRAYLCRLAAMPQPIPG